MLSRNNFNERVRQMDEKKERFSIRKLTVGAASVLIGLTIFGMNNSQSVKANTTDANSNQVAKQNTENSNIQVSDIPNKTSSATIYDSKKVVLNDTDSTMKAVPSAKTVGKKELSAQLNTETPVDTSNWQLYSSDKGQSGVYYLNWIDVSGYPQYTQHSYTGDNEANIVIPDAADFRKDPRYTKITSLELRSGLLSHLAQLPGIESISISKTPDENGKVEKVVASTESSSWINLMKNASSTLTSMDLSNLDTNRITDPSGMFAADSPSQGHLKFLDLTGWNTSNFRSMRQMFQNQPLTEIKGIEDWNTSNATDMSNMFFCGSADGLGGG